MIYKDLRTIEWALEELIGIKRAQKKDIQEKQKQFPADSGEFADCEIELDKIRQQTGQMKAALQNLRITPLS